MRKWIILFFSIIFVLLLSSCALTDIPFTHAITSPSSRITMLNTTDDFAPMKLHMEEIVTALHVKDAAAMKELFSPQAKKEISDLDLDIAYLFSLVDGDIVSWEDIGGNVSETVSHGHTVKEGYYRFSIYTKTEEYLCSFTECTENTDQPECVGIYSIKLFNVKDKEPSFTEAGIYRPEE